MIVSNQKIIFKKYDKELQDEIEKCMKEELLLFLLDKITYGKTIKIRITRDEMTKSECEKKIIMEMEVD